MNLRCLPLPSAARGPLIVQLSLATRGILGCLVSMVVIACSISQADESPTRIITTGWNAPTAQQFQRDWGLFQEQSFAGAVIHARADQAPPDPLKSAHSKDMWGEVSFSETEASLAAMSDGKASGSYLLLSANPGDADWLDDEAWGRIVARWRQAARLAKHGKLRGIAFDPEPYHSPLAQFDADVEPHASARSIQTLQEAARRRGREVMQAVVEEFPEIELFSYFWMSYFVRDHRYRGPSPIDLGGKRRADFDWCLAGHRYGLLPAFLTGLLEAAPATTRFVDGCEYAYWLTEAAQFNRLASDVRERGRMVVDEAVREKYDRQMSVAMPAFVDIMVPELIPQWTLNPNVPDRLGLFQKQLSFAVQASDGLVWLYSERGRWWPEPRETQLWHNKDVYPHWDELFPGCLDVIRQAQSMGKVVPPSSIASEATLSGRPANEDAMECVAEITAEDGEWQTDVSSRGRVEVSPPRQRNAIGNTTENVTKNVTAKDVEIRGAKEATAALVYAVVSGQRLRVAVQARQSGRGLCKLVVRYRDSSGEFLTQRGVESYAYPESQLPIQWRSIVVDVVVPEGARSLVATLQVSRQHLLEDRIEFRELTCSRLAPEGSSLE